MVLANPPFGRKSSVTMVGEDGKRRERATSPIQRQDFWATTSNKQLNFLQHIRSMLKIGGTRRGGPARQRALRGRGRARRSGAGCSRSATSTRSCACRPASSTPRASRRTSSSSSARPPRRRPRRSELWVYDFRTNQHFTLKTKTLKRSDLDDFVDGLQARRDRTSARRRSSSSAGRYEELAGATRLQPRHLGRRPGRVARRRGQPAGAGGHRRGDRREPDRGPGAVLGRGGRAAGGQRRAGSRDWADDAVVELLPDEEHRI